MRISKIKINNFMGIETMEFEAGTFTAITGKNGEGKSSILESIKYSLGGGHDATVIRNGATEAMVELGADDGSLFRTRIKPTGTDREFRDPRGIKQAKPASKIASLIDAMSVNPIEFLLAKPEKRTQILLESMPLKANPAEILKISGVKIAESEQHAFDVIEAVRKQLYDQRTGVNGAATAKRHTVTQLLQALPADGIEPDGDEDSLGIELETSDQGLKSFREKVGAQLQKEIESSEAAVSVLQAEITALQTKIAEERAHILDRKNKAAEAIRGKESAHEVIKTRVDAQIKAIRSQRDMITRATQTRENIIAMENDAAELERESADYTAKIKAIDAYKIDLLKNLPIPGLEVREGVIYFEGVPFDRVNTAKKVSIAVDIAKLRAGELGLICVDGIENLDQESYEAFRENAIKSGIQVVVTRVSEHELSTEVTE